MSIYAFTAKPSPKVVRQISEEPPKKVEYILDKENTVILETNSFTGLLTAPYSKKPLVCVAGEDRPPLVDEYQGLKPCDYAQAQKLIELAYKRFYQSCEVPRIRAEARLKKAHEGKRPYDEQDYRYSARKDRNFVSVDMSTKVSLHPFSDLSIQASNDSTIKSQPATCGEGEFAIPTLLHNFGLLNPEQIHPFFNIVFHFNADNFNDFRSAASFKQLAEEMAQDFKVRGIQQLRVGIPAGGSHMASLVVAFHLMDKKIINMADFTISEIDLNSPWRVEFYLNAMAQMKVKLPGKEEEEPLITELTENIETDTNDHGEKTVFRFKYRGMPITIVVLNNTGQEKFIPDDYLGEAHVANFLVFHDLGNSLEEKRLLDTMAKFHGGKDTTARVWAVSTQTPEPSSKNLLIRKLEGKFGCGREDSTGKLLGDDVWEMVGDGPDAQLEAGARAFMDPFSSAEYSGSGNIFDSRKRIKVHYMQEEHPFYLMRWN